MFPWPSYVRLLAMGFLLLVAHRCMAQEPKPKVILYKDRLAAQFDTVDVVKNVIKANPLLFFRGEIPIYFEHALSHKLSLEVGLGVTLRDYMTLTFSGDDADDFGAGTKIVPQLSYHIAARFYLGEDLEPQGWYLQPEFAHLDYVKDIRGQAPDGTFTDDTYRDQRTFDDLRLLAGYQMLSWTSNWLFDVYGGVGYRSRNLNKVEERIDLTSGIYTYTLTETTDRVPVIFLGLKVGVGF